MRQRQGEMVNRDVMQSVYGDLFARFRSASSVLSAATLCWLAFPGSAIAADDSARLFKDSVRPLFERKCFECHSSKADEVKGNLKLETLESILKGGDQGPAVVAGDVKDSFLLRAIRYEVEDFQMPPSGRLADEEIALVAKWIRSLAPANKQTPEELAR
jgi:mono/diheme cytochrome c family protein